MNRKVRRGSSRGKEESCDDEEGLGEVVGILAERSVDWTSLPHDAVLAIFGLLGYRDRASLASVCQTWRHLAASPCLWKSLDIRAHTLDHTKATYLARKCAKLQSLRFRGDVAASAILGLQAVELKDFNGEGCRDLTDVSLLMLAARHTAMESLQLGPYCDRITSDAVGVVALCCPRLKCLRLMGIEEVAGDTIRLLIRQCPNLSDLGLLDCPILDESAIPLAMNLRYLSVAGSRSIEWNAATLTLSMLPQLVALDVSRTEIVPLALSRLLGMENLKVLCALNCCYLEDMSGLMSTLKDKVVFAHFTDTTKGLAMLTSKTSTDSREQGTLVWCEQGWRQGDKNCSELLHWTEWVLSHALLRIASSNIPGLDSFWLKQGTATLLSLIKSSQEDVQERAVSALASFVVTGDVYNTVDQARAEAVMHGGGIGLLLDLAKSCREELQSEAAKALANLSVNAEVAKAVVVEGGVCILAALARSPNQSVAEEAAGALWSLAVGQEHKGAIAEAGGIKALMELIFKWPRVGDGVLERAAGALANLAADDKCSMEVALTGGVKALVTLARFCKHEGVQEQTARALANLAAHGDSNGNKSSVWQEAGAVKALEHLISSENQGVRHEAARALRFLSFQGRYREAIAAAGGLMAVLAQVAVAQGWSTSSYGL